MNMKRKRMMRRRKEEERLKRRRAKIKIMYVLVCLDKATPQMR
jgi:hypothetical protein